MVLSEREEAREKLEKELGITRNRRARTLLEIYAMKCFQEGYETASEREDKKRRIASAD